MYKKKRPKLRGNWKLIQQISIHKKKTFLFFHFFLQDEGSSNLEALIFVPLAFLFD